MISGCPVTFEEPDLTARIPRCTALIAAALAAGWRLASDGFPNHQDELRGVAHLQDFKSASKKQIHRVITFRFRQSLRVVEGAEVRVEEFLAQCQADPAFFRAAQEHPRFRHWHDQLVEKLPHTPLHVTAAEPAAHDRVISIPLGTAPDLAARLARSYEAGW